MFLILFLTDVCFFPLSVSLAKRRTLALLSSKEELELPLKSGCHIIKCAPPRHYEISLGIAIGNKKQNLLLWHVPE